MSEKDIKSQYFQKNTFKDIDKSDIKIDKTINQFDSILRYGNNPNQPACLYTNNSSKFNYTIIKNGKNGLSQTNIEDISYAINTIKYFKTKSIVIMKHVNICGGCSAICDKEPIKDVYLKSFNADNRAAFGGFVVSNTEIDKNCAKEIMKNFTEGIAAPSFTEDAIQTLKDHKLFNKNKEIRIIAFSGIEYLPKYIGDNIENYIEYKTLPTGLLIKSHPYLSSIKTINDFIKSYAIDNNGYKIYCNRYPNEKELNDLLFAWYTNINLKSNSIVIAKNQTTIAIGSGQQDRVGCIELAVSKSKKLNKDLSSSVISSDGFFPFTDSIEILAKYNITAIVQPGGSVNDSKVINECNKYNIAMVFTNERCFIH